MEHNNSSINPTMPKEMFDTLATLFLISMFLGFNFLSLLYAKLTCRTINITIKEKFLYGNSSGQFFAVDTKNNNYFIQNTFAFFNFNKFEMYSVLIPDNTYEVKVYGYRFFWLYLFPTIVGVKELPKNKDD